MQSIDPSLCSVDTPGVISQLVQLFRDYPTLLQGFNTFLPNAYHINVADDAHSQGLVIVTTPQGETRYLNGVPVSPPS